MKSVGILMVIILVFFIISMLEVSKTAWKKVKENVKN